MLTEKIPHLLYGGDYNPEQWPKDVWHEDVALMREAGVNLVTLGVFSWSRLEPREGTYDLGWLDTVMDLLAEGGVNVDLATATASPPPWLAARYPETLPVTADGVTLWPGSRQQYCPSSPAYRRAADALVERLAEHYAEHPALAMWHVGNEYGCHVRACYCEESARAFRAWLRRRYGTVEALNEAWGTTFWSQRYAAWEEIQPPRRAPSWVNPTQVLDFQRFSSDALRTCFEAERDILRRRTPAVPVTTNFMGFFKPLDYWSWAREEDLVSNDAYPNPTDPAAHVSAAMAGDLMRSLGRGAPWLLMEQAPSYVNWRPRNVPKPPGVMRLWSHQAVARGADGVMFFQWRAARFGTEKFHSAMVPHGELKRSRWWREARDLGAELRRLDAVAGTRVRARTAIVFDWESWWAAEIPPTPSSDVSVGDLVTRYYRPLYAANEPVDFVHPSSDLSLYRLVLAPNLYLTRDRDAAALDTYVRGGGTLVVGFLSGLVDERDHAWLGGYPGPLRDLLGIVIDELSPLPAGVRPRVALSNGTRVGCDVWADPIELESAEAIATYVDGPYPGAPAVTRRGLGEGRAYYVGTRLDDDGMRLLVDDLLDQVGRSALLDAPSGVEVVRRQAEGRSLLFLLNHRTDEAAVPLGRRLRDLITGAEQKRTVVLPPRGVAVLDEDLRPPCLPGAAPWPGSPPSRRRAWSR